MAQIWIGADNGAELLRRLRDAAPASEVAPLLVLCSGDIGGPDHGNQGSDVAAQAPNRVLADALLGKPVDLQELQLVLRQGGVRPQTTAARH